MLLTLIENYINAEPDSRQGVFIFLDMEKAFDRVIASTSSHDHIANCDVAVGGLLFVCHATEGATKTLPLQTATRKQLPPALSQPTLAIAQTPHPPPRSAVANPLVTPRELTAQWYPQAI